MRTGFHDVDGCDAPNGLISLLVSFGSEEVWRQGVLEEVLVP